MDPDEILSSMRTLILVVDADGIIQRADGGFGGFAGIDVDNLAGTSVFDRLSAQDAHELAIYFLETVGEASDTVALPMPFRLSFLDPGGLHSAGSSWSYRSA